MHISNRFANRFSNRYSHLQIKRFRVQHVARGFCRKVGRATVESWGKKSSELCFLDKLIVLINIFIIIVVLYLFKSIYRPFLIPYYNIMQCIVFNFVITIVLFIFISKYLYHSLDNLLLLSLFLVSGKIR